MISFEQRISELMNVYDITQADICKKSGVPKSTLSMYIKGTRIPKNNNIVLIANAYGIDPVWLMGYDVPMVSKSSSVDIENAILDAKISNDVELKEVLKIYYSLPEQKRADIRRYIKFVSDI